MSESSAEAAVARPAHGDHLRHALEEVKPQLKRRALELVGFLLVVYAVLKLIPALEEALHAIEHASWEWVLALIAIEVLSRRGSCSPGAGSSTRTTCSPATGGGAEWTSTSPGRNSEAASFSPEAHGEAWDSPA
ncbi:MAG: hypothetical protein JO304_03190 [Solirubrobacterales bacterium]|nr:hypothetical protein [Solirubrobacterales bacterium]